MPGCASGTRQRVYWIFHDARRTTPWHRRHSRRVHTPARGTRRRGGVPADTGRRDLRLRPAQLPHWPMDQPHAGRSGTRVCRRSAAGRQRCQRLFPGRPRRCRFARQLRALRRVPRRHPQRLRDAGLRRRSLRRRFRRTRQSAGGAPVAGPARGERTGRGAGGASGRCIARDPAPRARARRAAAGRRCGADRRARGHPAEPPGVRTARDPGAPCGARAADHPAEWRSPGRGQRSGGAQLCRRRGSRPGDRGDRVAGDAVAAGGVPGRSRSSRDGGAVPRAAADRSECAGRARTGRPGLQRVLRRAARGAAAAAGARPCTRTGHLAGDRPTSRRSSRPEAAATAYSSRRSSAAASAARPVCRYSAISAR
jgi:hypothetical protein